MVALWLACDATFTLATVAAAGGLTWSAPVLLEAPTASWPLGPDSPAYAYGFDHKHMFGPKSGIKEGRGSTWQFSSDGGLSFVTQTTHLSGAVNTLIPIDDPSIPGRRSFRDLGHYDLGSAKAATRSSIISPALRCSLCCQTALGSPSTPRPAASDPHTR